MDKNNKQNKKIYKLPEEKNLNQSNHPSINFNYNTNTNQNSSNRRRDLNENPLNTLTQRKEKNHCEEKLTIISNKFYPISSHANTNNIENYSTLSSDDNNNKNKYTIHFNKLISFMNNNRNNYHDGPNYKMPNIYITLKKKGITTLEKVLEFSEYPTKLTKDEDKKLQFLLSNIRNIRDELPGTRQEQIVYLLKKPLVFDTHKSLTPDLIIKAHNALNKFGKQSSKPSSVFVANLERKLFTNIQNLESFTNLKSLYLNDNQIQKIENVNLPSLELLDLSNNYIRKMENLESLFNLKELKLSKNCICIFENIQNNIKLEDIDLSNQYIPEFIDFAIHPQCGGFKNMVASINLENCNVNNCEMLVQFPYLRSINLKGNKIVDFMKVLSVCKMCPYIQKVNVLKNPFTLEQKGTYKNFLIVACKNIVEIDEKEIKENEKIYVNNLFAKKYNQPVKKYSNNQAGKNSNVADGLTVTRIEKNYEANNLYMHNDKDYLTGGGHK